MSEREEALARIVELIQQHGLTPGDVSRALAAREPVATGRRSGVLGKLFAWLGGTFVLAGLCVFVNTLWDGMNAAERIVITLGPGLAALVLSYLASRSAERTKLTTPLFLIAVLLEPTGLLVTLQEFSVGGNQALGALLVSGVMAAQCALFFLRVHRDSVVFFTLVYGCLAVSSALAWIEVDWALNGLVVGISTFLVTLSVARSKHEPITPFWFFLSSALVLVSWFDVVHGSVAEVTQVGLAAGLVYLSTLLRSRALLAAGTLGLLGYIGYFSGRYFADSVGWPLLLILLGIVMMALGAAAVRIHRRFIRGSP